MNVTVDINNESFSANCCENKLQKCKVNVFLRNLTRYATLDVSVKNKGEEKIIKATCCEQGTKDLLLATRSICETCVKHKAR